MPIHLLPAIMAMLLYIALTVGEIRTAKVTFTVRDVIALLLAAIYLAVIRR